MRQRITIDHVGIAAKNLEDGSRFWTLIGLMQSGDDDRVEEQVGNNAFLPT